MKLNQIIALEDGSKTRATAHLTGVYHTLQKTELLAGLERTYRPLAETEGGQGERLPGESKRIQVRVEDVLSETAGLLTKWFDVAAAKDWSNTKAKADVTVDGKVVLGGVPVTFLMFLEKRLVDLHTLVSKLPILDPSEEWTPNDAQRAFATRPVETARTKKVPKVVVLHAPTKEHPAQTTLLQEDVIAGYWTQIKYSSAVPQAKQKALLDRVVKLQEAVKKAREEANHIPAEEPKVGALVFGFLFGV